MDLSYKEVGDGTPVIILHGLFGSSDNWFTIAKELAKKNKIYLIDLRNHGNSPHNDTFNYEVMANDIKSFIEKYEIINPVVLGHSMGGKAAMELAVLYSQLIKRLIVVDIGPKEYPVHHELILEGLCAIDLTKLKSRTEADFILSNYVKEQGLRQFLLKNLSRNSQNGFQWKINLQAIKANIENVGDPLNESTSFEKPTLFIRGENSDYILDTDMVLINKIFLQNQLKTIGNAGHWVHAEQPLKFIEIVKKFLS